MIRKECEQVPVDVLSPNPNLTIVDAIEEMNLLTQRNPRAFYIMDRVGES
jgi:hypothetical protein